MQLNYIIIFNEIMKYNVKLNKTYKYNVVTALNFSIHAIVI